MFVKPRFFRMLLVILVKNSYFSESLESEEGGEIVFFFFFLLPISTRFAFPSLPPKFSKNINFGIKESKGGVLMQPSRNQ